MQDNKYLPSCLDTDLSDERIRKELIQAQDCLGFKLFCNQINNRLDNLDSVLAVETDKEKIVSAVFKRQILSSIIADYYTSIDIDV